MEIPYTLTARPDTGLYNGKLGIWLFLASEVMLFGALFTAYLFVRLGAEDGTWPDHVQNSARPHQHRLLIISSITMVWAWVALKERKFNTYRLALGLTILCGVAFLCIKGIEYHDKYDHWGFMIKADAIGKYMPELQKMDAFYSRRFPPSMPTKSRPLRNEKTATTFTFVPDQISIPGDQSRGPKRSLRAGKSRPAEKSRPSPSDKPTSTAGNFLPAYGTYYAIYFTVTGLHALHIIGGIVVMTYFLTIGSRLYKRNPEQLSNRIEVTGIFWHFVDLVWITVFPILYLT
jgi:cytochrome c oxidase subunit 3